MTNKITTFLSEDLENILKKTGELELINNGERYCNICNNVITLKNIQVIYKSNDVFVYICDNAMCINCYNNLK